MLNNPVINRMITFGFLQNPLNGTRAAAAGHLASERTMINPNSSEGHESGAHLHVKLVGVHLEAEQIDIRLCSG